MQKSEIIKMYEAEIIEAMIEYYEEVIRCNRRIQYDLYIWEDGELEPMQTVSGDNCWLVPHNGESRELFFVTTVKVDSSFNIWDGAGDISIPEDEDKAAEVEEELIQELVEVYKNEQVYVDYHGALDTAILEERWEDFDWEDKP